jgi:hypothetical protein
VKNVGKPCAGEPHARFDGRRLETERCRSRSKRKLFEGNPRQKRPDLKPNKCHRASLRPSHSVMLEALSLVVAVAGSGLVVSSLV